MPVWYIGEDPVMHLEALSDSCSLMKRHRSVAVHEEGYVGLRIDKKDWDGVKKIGMV